ncbi:hypothetical protein DV735_g3550, partial [Chaetothyriales sp. CBS 134920]
MDDHDQYDSVQWERGSDPPHQASSSSSAFPETRTSLPSRPAPGQNGAGSGLDEQRGSAAAHDNGGEAVDLTGISRDGVLEVTVDTPLKENDGTKDAYVSYLVTTHTNFKTFQRSNLSVRRRFTDFVFLRSSLHRDYPACAVPPLPDKNAMSYVRGDRFSTEFTQRRAWSLHRFIKRCTLHPVLRRAPVFLLFLEASDWNSVMRPTNAATGFLDSVADTMLNAFSRVHKPDKRFIEVTERTSKLCEDLTHIEKTISRVARRQADLEADYLDLATNMRKLTPLEPAIAAPLHTFAGCVEETSRGWRTLRDHTDQNYVGSLRDMEAYIGSVNGPRPTAFIRNKVEDIRGVDHETARKDRIRKLELKIQELTREVESAKTTSDMFDDHVVREVADFDRIKGLEFRDSLGGLAEHNISFYQSVIHTWERFLADMDVKQDTAKVPAR